MKKILLLSILLTSCSSASYNFPIEFPNRMPEVLFENNVRDCRSKPQCSVDELFDRW